MTSTQTHRNSGKSQSLKSLLFRVAIGLGLTSSLFGQSTLSLSSGSASPGGTVTLNLSLASVTGSEPAALEWTIGYPISAIASVNAVAGSAASGAGKSLSCSGSSGSYTCQVSGMNVNPIVNGMIAAITFTLTPTAATTPITVTNGSSVLGSGTALTVAQTGGNISVSGAIQSNLSSVVCSPASVVGGATSNCTVNLTAGAPAGGSVVSLADNSTFVTVPASVTIPGGSTSASFTASTSAVTSTQSAVITASLGGVSQTALLSVTTPSITLLSILCSPSTVIGGSFSACTVALASAAPSGGVVVGLTTTSDIITLPVSITVPAGSASASFTVTTLSGFSTRPAAITATYNGLSQTATLTVAAPSTLLLTSIQCAPGTVLGGVSSTCTVALSGVAPAGGAAVSLSVNSTAVTVPSSITVAAGAASATFTAATSAVASTQSAVISGSYGGASQTASLTVTSPAVTLLSLQCAPGTVVGGVASTCTVALSGVAPTGGAAVSLSDNNAAVTVPSSITVAAGAASATFTAATSAVASTQSAVISGSYGGASQTASLTVTSPAVTLLSLQCAPGTVVGGVASTCTVALSGAAPTGGAAVSLSDNNAAVTVPSSITVAAGASSATFTAATSAVVSTQSAVITGSYNGATQTATLTVTSAAVTLLSLQCSPGTVIGGSSSTCTAALSGAAPAGGAVVSLSDNSTAVTVPPSVTILAGTSSVTFAASTSAVVSTQSAVITGSYNGATQTASLTVTSPAVTLLSLQCAPGTVAGGVSSTCTVALTGAAPAGGAVVSLAVNNTSVTVPPSVAIAAGTSSAIFTATTSAVVSTQSAVITGVYNASAQTGLLTVTAAAVTLTSIQCAPGTVTGAASSICTLMLSGAAPAGGAVVILSSNSTAATVPASTTIPAGSSSTTFTAATSAVTSTQVAVIAASYAGVSQTASLTVTGPGLSVSSIQCLPATVMGGDASTCTVMLAGVAPSGGALINLSDSSMVVTIPASVTVPAGATSTTFTASTSAVSVTLSVAITATYAPPVLGAPLKGAPIMFTSQTASLTVSPLVIALAGMQCTPATIVSGSSSTCTTTLTAPAPAAGVTAAIASSNSRLSVPASLSFQAGATSASFAAKALFKFSGSATVSATLQGKSVTATITAGSRKTTQTVTAAGTTNVAQFTVRPADQTTVAGAATPALAPTLSNVRPSELFCSPKQVQAGDSITCNLQLSSANLPEGTDIMVSAGDASLQVPAAVSPRPGQSTLSFEAMVSPQAQTHSASIAVTLGAMSAQDQVMVLANPTPVLTVPGPQFALAGSALSFNVTASSGSGALVYLSSDRLPPGATFNRGSGRFIWTPKRSQQGTWNISFTATDQNHNAAPGEVSIEVGDGTPKIDRIVHSASNSSDAVCTAGSLAAIYGAWLSTGVASDPTGASFTLAGTKVAFDGKYAALVYASPTEVIVICPAVVTANVTVEAAAGRSAAVRIQVQGTAPGIFTVDGSGTGQASASIEGGMLIAAPRNYLYAAEPAQPGDHLSIPVTGLNPDASFPASAQIGDQYVPIDWIRPVAGWAGVMEVGVTLPAAVQTGDAVSMVLQQLGLDGRTNVVSKPVSIAIEPVRP